MNELLLLTLLNTSPIINFSQEVESKPIFKKIIEAKLDNNNVVHCYWESQEQEIYGAHIINKSKFNKIKFLSSKQFIDFYNNEDLIATIKCW